MATLDDIMNAPESPKKEYAPSPEIRIDYEKKDTQVIRFRFLKDLPKLEIMIRHWDEDLKRWVACAQVPGLKDEYDRTKKAKVVGKDGKPVKVPTLWSHGWVDGVKIPHCKRCEAKAEKRRGLEANALKEYENGQRKDGKLTQQEGIELGKVYKRQLVMRAPVEAEVREGNEVVKPLAGGVILFSCYDLYFPQFDSQYKQLKSKFTNKKTLLDNWFILNGEGQIDLDDKLTKSEKAVEVEVDEAYFDNQTLSYAEAEEKAKVKANASAEATPKADPKSKSESDDSDLEVGDVPEDEIPF